MNSGNNGKCPVEVFFLSISATADGTMLLVIRENKF